MFLIKYILRVLNIIAVLCLLLSYSASYISPEKFWIFAFFGIAYPVFLVINLIFIIIWLIRLKWFALVSLITILIGINNILNLISFNFNQNKTSEKKLISILSYNVRNFDVFTSNAKKNRTNILKFIKKQNTDILCIQEFYYDKLRGYSSVDSILSLKKSYNYHVEYSKISKRNEKFGIATFTDFPIINRGKIKFVSKSGNICIYTDILYNNDTIRIYNVHFESIKFGIEDYKFAEDINNISSINDNNEFNRRSMQIFNRLKSGFIKRAVQAQLVAEHMQDCPYPIVLCGDFNDTPSSYCYHLMVNDLTDSFKESGKGFGQTYIGIFPSFRIDYILHDENFTSSLFKTINVEYSDHYPVKCNLSFNKNN